MTSNYLPIIISVFAKFAISLLVFCQLSISVVSQQDFVSQNYIPNDSSINKGSEITKVLRKESNATLDHFGEELEHHLTFTFKSFTQDGWTTEEPKTTTLISIPEDEIYEKYVQVLRGSGLAYGFELPKEGLLIKIQMKIGAVTVYYAYNNPEPDEQNNDGQIPMNNKFFIPVRPNRNKKNTVLYQSQNSDVFVKIYGNLDINKLSLFAERGVTESTTEETITDQTRTETAATSVSSEEPFADNPSRSKTIPTSDASTQEPSTDNPTTPETIPTNDPWTQEPSTDNPTTLETMPPTDASTQEPTTDNLCSSETTPTTDDSVQETTTDQKSTEIATTSIAVTSEEPVTDSDNPSSPDTLAITDASKQKPFSKYPCNPKAPPTTGRSTDTTSAKTMTTTTRPPNGVLCEGQVYGYNWEVNSGIFSEIKCSNLIPNATGKANWYCREDGKFKTPYPDVSGCNSSFIQKWLARSENINNIENATNYMRELEDELRDKPSNKRGYQYFGHEIVQIADMVDKVISKAQRFNATFNKFQPVIRNAVNINALLIKSGYQWNFLDNRNKSNTSTIIFGFTESALFNLLNKTSDPSYSFTADDVEEESIFDLMIFAEKFDRRKNYLKKKAYEFPHNRDRGLQDSFIKLPPDWKELHTDDEVKIAAMSVDAEYVSYAMPGQYDLTAHASVGGSGNGELKLVNGNLISLTIPSSNTSEMLEYTRMSFSGKGAEITVYHDIEAWGEERQDVYRKLHPNEKPRAVLGTTQCVFWDTNKLVWSENGCRTIKSNRFRTVCECSHLTSFAVLMDVHRYVGKQLALEILTLILCPLSEICLILSIVILSSVNNLQRIRTTITKNLAGCLFVGNALVLLVLDRNYFNMNEGLCIGSAMLTHYVFLCAFMWMLIEGVQLYRMVIHVFDSGKSYLKHFAVFAYGSPLLVVTITATTGYLQGDKPYGGDVYCWLEGAYIWSFMGPVAVIIMINLVILSLALRTSYKLEKNKNRMSTTFFRGKIKAYRTLFKGCFFLTCILGITWVVGFFTLMKAPSGIIAAYIFTVLNSSQGIFIFLFNCVFNEKVRSFIKRKLSTSTCLPTCLLPSISSNTCRNGDFAHGTRPVEAPAIVQISQVRHSKELSSPVEPMGNLNIPRAKLSEGGNGEAATVMHQRKGSIQVELHDRRVIFLDDNPVENSELMRSVPNVDSSSNSTTSSNAAPSSDTSQVALISAFKSKSLKNN